MVRGKEAVFEAYGSFRSSLLLMADVHYNTVKEAFMQEARNRQPRAMEQSMALQAAAHRSPPYAGASNSKECTFCGMSGHLADGCFKMRDFSRQAKEEVKERQSKQKGKKGKGRAKAHSAEEEAETPQEAEFAGNASTSDYTNPHSPLISDAGADWNTDTGATCHMTPHRHWFNSPTSHM